MSADPNYYVGVFRQAAVDTESLTIVLVTGSTRRAVVQALGVDERRPLGQEQLDRREDLEDAWYAIADVAGGFLAMENSGYGDPSNLALAELSAGGGTAAVVRGNTQGHERFGYARDTRTPRDHRGVRVLSASRQNSCLDDKASSSKREFHRPADETHDV
ncbi:hypothetical protein GCM10009795_022240 [Nocardioides hankookensis]